MVDCPNNFIITAQAADETIEAIKHKDLPWEAWMWHPERELRFSEIEIRRIKDLFNVK